MTVSIPGIGVSITDTFSASSITGTVPVANGGTGAATLTGVLKGNGTSAISAATAGTDFVAPGTVTSFTAQQNFTAASITSTSNSIAWNLSTAQSAKHTLTENTTLANPTNMVDGGTYILRITQHASSAKTFAFGSAYRWPGGAAPTITATLNGVDIITFISDGTHMDGSIRQAFA